MISQLRALFHILRIDSVLTYLGPVTLMVFLSGTAQACMTELEAAEILKEVSLQEEDVPLTKSQIKQRLCDKESPAYQMLSHLRLMKNIKISSAPLEGRYNPNIIGNDFWKFFTERIDRVRIVNGDNERCKNGAMAFVDISESKFPKEKGIAQVCPLFYDKYFSDYERVSVLLHESRHVEGFPHVMCEAGNKVGSSGGCDDRIQSKGAYAVTVESLAKMALRGINIPEKDKEDLKTLLLVQLDSFNELVRGRGNMGIILEIDQSYPLSNQSFFFDGKALYPIHDFGSHQWVSRVFGVLGIPLEKSAGFSIDIFKKNLQKKEPLGGCIKAYNESPREKRQVLIDIVLDAHYSACIFENEVRGRVSVNDGDDAIASFKEKIESVYTSDEVGDQDRDSFYVRTQLKTYYRLRFDEKTNKFDVQRVANPVLGMKRLFFFNSDLTGITNDGRLMVVDPESNQWEPFSGVEKLRFKKATRPFFWSADLVER